VISDVFSVLDEDGESVGFFNFGFIDFSVLSFEVSEIFGDVNVVNVHE